MKNQFRCVFCEKVFDGKGNNPKPASMKIRARCCDECNEEIVLPARIKFNDIFKKNCSPTR